MNFVKYRDGRGPVMYSGGGYFPRSPARVTIPEEGRWYAVADFRGYRTNPQATVQVLTPAGGPESADGQEDCVALEEA